MKLLKIALACLLCIGIAVTLALLIQWLNN